MGQKISLGMLLLGAALLWPVPLGGVLLLVTAGIGLAIAWEAELMASAVPEPDAGGGELVIDLTDLGARADIVA